MAHEGLSKEELTATIRDVVREELKAAKLNIDVENAIGQLQSAPGKLRAYLMGEHRFVEVLKERNRRAAKATYDFIDQNMPNALFAVNQFPVIESYKDKIAPNTPIMDLGVYKGNSTRQLARIFPNHTIHGFDSFEGLPDDWAHVPKGAFGELKGQLPDVPANVKLYKGWFNETLPVWRTQHTSDWISLLRVDCDIYSSTKVIFDELGHMLRSGSYICFDELIGYYGFQEHEYKAFKEFLDRKGFSCEYLAYGLTYTMVRLV